MVGAAHGEAPAVDQAGRFQHREALAERLQPSPCRGVPGPTRRLMVAWSHRPTIVLGFLLAWAAVPTLGLADVLVATNGERFVGKVIAESADAIVFESNLAGRLTLPRA